MARKNKSHGSNWKSQAAAAAIVDSQSSSPVPPVASQLSDTDVITTSRFLFPLPRNPTQTREIPPQRATAVPFHMSDLTAVRVVGNATELACRAPVFPRNTVPAQPQLGRSRSSNSDLPRGSEDIFRNVSATVGDVVSEIMIMMDQSGLDGTSWLKENMDGVHSCYLKMMARERLRQAGDRVVDEPDAVDPIKGVYGMASRWLEEKLKLEQSVKGGGGQGKAGR
ncbi:uncharacterized protein LOC135607621 [Musa acuminata AAA Group]|uniref:uncharacterized protein LOC135607621 n=1 Tax=Musa acuminata AAA Group TaxID=214697 RepID=UPI0031E3CA70